MDPEKSQRWDKSFLRLVPSLTGDETYEADQREGRTSRVTEDSGRGSTHPSPTKGIFLTVKGVSSFLSPETVTLSSLHDHLPVRIVPPTLPRDGTRAGRVLFPTHVSPVVVASVAVHPSEESDCNRDPRRKCPSRQ